MQLARLLGNGASFPCRAGHVGPRACGSRDYGSLKGLSGSANSYLIGFARDLIDQKTDIGLAQGWVLTPESLPQEVSESSDYIRRDPTLARS